MEQIRSWMFVPGHRQRMIDKALGLNADAIMLDIEAISGEPLGPAVTLVLAAKTVFVAMCASALAMHKERAKAVLRAAGVPVAESVVLSRAEAARANYQRQIEWARIIAIANLQRDIRSTRLNLHGLRADSAHVPGWRKFHRDRALDLARTLHSQGELDRRPRPCGKRRLEWRHGKRRGVGQQDNLLVLVLAAVADDVLDALLIGHFADGLNHGAAGAARDECAADDPRHGSGHRARGSDANLQSLLAGRQQHDAHARRSGPRALHRPSRGRAARRTGVGGPGQQAPTHSSVQSENFWCFQMGTSCLRSSISFRQACRSPASRESV